ncbi:MAG: hypothetical protein JNL44_10835 [Gemmatimonadetes bacterium]|nr:hypothetical protein [Gemmatimonadota bacterium]
MGALLTCLGAVLGGTASAQARVVHPTDEYLSSIRATSVISKDIAAAKGSSADAMAARLRRARRIDSIGTLDGPLETVFGTIADVAVAPSGAIYILDIANQLVRGFSPTGVPVIQLGRLGSGPPDLRTPLSIWTEGDSTVVVADGVLGIKYFSAKPRSSTPTRVLRLGAPPIAACATGDHVVSVGTSGEPIGGSVKVGVEPLGSVTARSGELVRRFGESYPSENAMVRRSMSESVVACTPEGTIVTSLSKLPFVTGYRADGSPSWVARLKDFVVGRHVEEANSRGQRSIGIDDRDPRNSFVRRITPVGGSMVVVQVGLMTPESIRDRSIWSRIDSYVVDVRDGQGAFVSSTLPLLAAMRGERLVAFENDPYPRVVLIQVPRN